MPCLSYQHSQIDGSRDYKNHLCFLLLTFQITAAIMNKTNNAAAGITSPKLFFTIPNTVNMNEAINATIKSAIKTFEVRELNSVLKNQ